MLAQEKSISSPHILLLLQRGKHTHTHAHKHRKRTIERDRPYIHFVSLGRLYILAKGFKDITVGVKWVLKNITSRQALDIVICTYILKIAWSLWSLKKQKPHVNKDYLNFRNKVYASPGIVILEHC